MCSRSGSRNITHKTRWRRCSAWVMRRSDASVLVVALILAQPIERAVAAELAHLAPQRLLAIGPRQKLEGAHRQQIGIDADLVLGGQRVTAPQEAERRRLAQAMRAEP